METQILTPEPIQKELVKHNITDSIIEQMRSEFMPLNINGIKDRKGYRAVKAARIKCKYTRVLAEKICKIGRQAAIAEQRAWISKEKEVCGKIEEIELHLEAQEKEIDAQVEAERLEKERIERERVQSRVDVLTSYGAPIDIFTLAKMSDAHFNDLVASSKIAWETEQARLAKEKQDEKDRLDKIAAENQAERIRLKNIDKEQKQKERELVAKEQALIPVAVVPDVPQAKTVPIEKIAEKAPAYLTYGKLKEFCDKLTKDQLEGMAIVYFGDWFSGIAEAEFIHGEVRMRLENNASFNQKVKTV